MNKNACELGPKTEDLPAVKAEIEICRQRGKDKNKYRNMLETLSAEGRRAWLNEQKDRAYWIGIAEEVRNEK